jgi:hypothetical protein
MFSDDLEDGEVDGRRHQWELNIDETSEVILGRGGHPSLARCWPCCVSDGPESHAVSDTTEIWKRLGSKARYFLIEHHSWIPGTNATDSTEMGHQSFSATVQYIPRAQGCNTVLHLSGLSMLNRGTRSANAPSETSVLFVNSSTPQRVSPPFPIAQRKHAPLPPACPLPPERCQPAQPARPQASYLKIYQTLTYARPQDLEGGKRTQRYTPKRPRRGRAARCASHPV